MVSTDICASQRSVSGRSTTRWSTLLCAVVRVGVSIVVSHGGASAADVLVEPRRLVDALVPMLERQRPVAQRADHRLGDGGVVVGDVLLGDAVARIEDAVGMGEV